MSFFHVYAPNQTTMPALLMEAEDPVEACKKVKQQLQESGINYPQASIWEAMEITFEEQMMDVIETII